MRELRFTLIKVSLEAVEALDRALQLDPQFADTYYNRGALRA
jgi:hypothetical protein